MKSVFTDQTEDAGGDSKGKGVPTKVPYPVEFEEMARRIIDTVREALSANEVRALAADKSACPVLAVRILHRCCMNLFVDDLTSCSAATRDGI